MRKVSPCSNGIAKLYDATMTITPSQSRAARALLGWSQTDLVGPSKVSIATIKAFESGSRRPTAANTAAIQRALEEAGVIFIEENGEGPGVRLRKRERRE